MEEKFNNCQLKKEDLMDLTFKEMTNLARDLIGTSFGITTKSKLADKIIFEMKSF